MSNPDNDTTNNVAGTQNNVENDQHNAGRDITIHHHYAPAVSPTPDSPVKTQTLEGVWQWYDQGEGLYDPQLNLHSNTDGVAIVVSVRANVVRDVSAHLRKNKIDADLIVVTNNSSPEHISGLSLGQPGDWMVVVNRFKELLSYVKGKGSRPIHFFCVGPVALAFALGVKGGGNRHNIFVYQLQGDAYYLIYEFKAGQD